MRGKSVRSRVRLFLPSLAGRVCQCLKCNRKRIPLMLQNLDVVQKAKMKSVCECMMWWQASLTAVYLFYIKSRWRWQAVFSSASFFLSLCLALSEPSFFLPSLSFTSIPPYLVQTCLHLHLSPLIPSENFSTCADTHFSTTAINCNYLYKTHIHMRAYAHTDASDVCGLTHYI